MKTAERFYFADSSSYEYLPDESGGQSRTVFVDLSGWRTTMWWSTPAIARADFEGTRDRARREGRLKEPMTRRALFAALATDAFYARLYERLSKKDVEWCFSFLDDNAATDAGAFEFAVNRLWLDSPEKPKRYRDIIELLLAANSRVNL